MSKEQTFLSLSITFQQRKELYKTILFYNHQSDISYQTNIRQSKSYQFISQIQNQYNSMKKKTINDQQLKISEYIKQPASLKLLILAGTNIRPNQLSTINKCTGLIKLDLSSNFLGDLPLKFSHFPQLKILYIHDNQLTKVDIPKTSLDYISLFSNPIKWYQYRKIIIASNQNLLALDKNIICSKQRIQAENQMEQQAENMASNTSLHQYKNQLRLPLYTELKWPIVQISSNLQHEDDYLNLLKAEIFVINNVHKRTQKIQLIQNIFHSVIANRKYMKIRSETGKGGKSSRLSIFLAIKAAKKWKQYTLLKRKLRKILQKKGKEDLLMNQLEVKKRERGDGISEVMEAFLPLVRRKMKARPPFQRNIRSYKLFIPAQKQFYLQYMNLHEERNYETDPVRLYFKDSQLQILGKVMLYAKKLLFQQKQYDLCDQFTKLFKETSKRYQIFRSKQRLQTQRSWLLNSIHQTISMVTRQQGINRKNLLYSRKGHKQINIKSLSKFVKKQLYQQKLQRCTKRLNYLENKYDKLLEYEVRNMKILKLMLRIIRYINAGNSQTIISTQTAYFQTQVHFKDDQNKQQQKRVFLYFGLEFFVKRMNAANIIQRFWRRKLTQKNSKKLSLIPQLKQYRASILLNKWFSNLIFHHRVVANKTNSYYKSIWKETQVYFHLDIYMNIPEPTNLLRYSDQLFSKNGFYDLFHKGTQSQIVEAVGRKWLKITYQNKNKAVQAQKVLFKNTYRYYYHGFSLRFFNHSEIKNINSLLQYQKRVNHLFKIKVEVAQIRQKTSILWIDNINPYFIWSEMQLESTKDIFLTYQKKSTNVSIFIYNKHKRPLKVICQFIWVQPESIYLNKRIVRSVSVSHTVQASVNSMQNSNAFKNQNQKKLPNLDQSLNKKYYVDMPGNRVRGRANSLRKAELMKSHRTRIVSDPRLELLSETLNIKRK